MILWLAAAWVIGFLICEAWAQRTWPDYKTLNYVFGRQWYHTVATFFVWPLGIVFLIEFWLHERKVVAEMASEAGNRYLTMTIEASAQFHEGKLIAAYAGFGVLGTRGSSRQELYLDGQVVFDYSKDDKLLGCELLIPIVDPESASTGMMPAEEALFLAAVAAWRWFEENPDE